LERTLRERVLRVGVGGFPPYSIINPSEADPNNRFTGYSVDLVREIAARAEPPLRIEFSQVNFETMKVELEQGRYDVIVDPIYKTVSRGGDFGTTIPFTFTGVACAVVRIDESRFETFADLDDPNITIALAVGWTSTEFAKQHLKNANFLEISVAGSPFEQLDAVMSGRADVALQDTPSVAQYVSSHPGKVKALWLDNPPSLVAAGFLTRRSDRDFTRYLSNAIEVLRADDTLRRIDAHWRTYGYFERPLLDPGQGLQPNK
jgi:cyclohexadienyl dehydratase